MEGGLIKNGVLADKTRIYKEKAPMNSMLSEEEGNLNLTRWDQRGASTRRKKRKAKCARGQKGAFVRDRAMAGNQPAPGRETRAEALVPEP